MAVLWGNREKREAFRAREWTRDDWELRRCTSRAVHSLRCANLEGRLIAIRTDCRAHHTSKTARGRLQLSEKESSLLIEMLHAQQGRCIATGLPLQFQHGSPKECMLSLSKIDQAGPRAFPNVAITCGFVSNIINLAGLSAYVANVQAWGTRMHGAPGCCALTGARLNAVPQRGMARWWNTSLDRVSNSNPSHSQENVQVASLWPISLGADLKSSSSTSTCITHSFNSPVSSSFVL